jgi:hypothetical protein
VYRISKIAIEDNHVAIRGDGSGITILEVPGRIAITGKEPRLYGYTLIGSGNRGAGITLKNNAWARIEDVEVRSYECSGFMLT